MSINVRSLFESSGDNVFLSAAGWIEGAMLGSVATMAAVLAIAGIGFLLLQGRLVVKDGIRVIIGCFVIFGAAAIAQGLVSASNTTPGQQQFARAHDDPAISIPNIPEQPEEYDPYAGAAPKR